jgi:hypothetical protein
VQKKIRHLRICLAKNRGEAERVNPSTSPPLGGQSNKFSLKSLGSPKKAAEAMPIYGAGDDGRENLQFFGNPIGTGPRAYLLKKRPWEVDKKIRSETRSRYEDILRDIGIPDRA